MLGCRCFYAVFRYPKAEFLLPVGDHEPGYLKCPVVACDLFGDGLVESFCRGFAFDDDLWLHGVIVEYEVCTYGPSGVSSLEWDFEGEAVSAPSLDVEQAFEKCEAYPLFRTWHVAAFQDGVEQLANPFIKPDMRKVVHGLVFM